MKTITYAIVLLGLASVIPAQASRSGRPGVVITTTSSTTPPVTPF